MTVSFNVGSKAGVTGVNPNKRKLPGFDSTQSLKKPKVSVFGESASHELNEPPLPITVKRFPLTSDTLATFNRNMATQNRGGLAAWQGTALRAGATPEHLRPDRVVKSTPTTSSPTRGTRSSRSSRQSSISSHQSSEFSSRRARGTRMTDSFILFWGGALSNWNTGKRFSGQRAMDILLPHLAALQPLSYPGRHRFATQLLATHHFVCGEQFMMACKAWLFETEIYDLAKSEWETLPEGKFKEIRHRLMLPTQPESIPEKAMWHSSLCKILRAHHPKDQKELGRHTPNFSEEAWTRANMAIVIAASVARAEADEDLGMLYKGNKDGKRRFVEGSPYDRIWGVGLLWNAKEIDNERNWKGENRLGRCHDEACKTFNEEAKQRDWKAEAPAPKSGW